MRRLIPLVLLIMLATVGVGVPSPAAIALIPGKGYEGNCVGNDALTGTTIAVDFQQLYGSPGGPSVQTMTRCSPNPNPNPGTDRTGVKALQDAGFELVGAEPYGLAFICRIENQPNPNRESCQRTPPASAYWSYWHADGSGTTWTYSQYGAGNRKVIPGGFEGWSFSMNAGPDTNPPPRQSPRNPAVGNNPVVSLSVDDLDRTITLGQSVRLSWTSSRATSLTAHAVSPRSGGGAWSGPLSGPNGSKSVKPTAKGTYTYTIRATGNGKSVLSTAELTVR